MKSALIALSILIAFLASSPVFGVETPLQLGGEEFQAIRGQPIALPVFASGTVFDRLHLVLQLNDGGRLEYTETVLAFDAPIGTTLTATKTGSEVDVLIQGALWKTAGQPILFVLGVVKPDAAFGTISAEVTSVEASYEGRPVVVGTAAVWAVLVRDACLTISVEMQGGARPAPAGYAVPLRVSYRNQDYPDFGGAATLQMAHSGGKSAQADLCGLVLGEHDITIKDPQTLSNHKVRILITEPQTRQDMGVLLSGDIDDNNVVNILDFGALSYSFGSVPGDPNWDPRSDLDRNLVVNISDFGLLSLNFLKAGPIEIVNEVPELPTATTNSHTWTTLDVCQGVHIWGYHRTINRPADPNPYVPPGVAGYVFKSYIEKPEDLPWDVKIDTFPLAPSAFLGNFFTTGTVVAVPGRIVAAAQFYPFGIHLARAKFFDCIAG